MRTVMALLLVSAAVACPGIPGPATLPWRPSDPPIPLPAWVITRQWVGPTLSGMAMEWMNRWDALLRVNDVMVKP